MINQINNATTNTMINQMNNAATNTMINQINNVALDPAGNPIIDFDNMSLSDSSDDEMASYPIYNIEKRTQLALLSITSDFRCRFADDKRVINEALNRKSIREMILEDMNEYGGCVSLPLVVHKILYDDQIIIDLSHVVDHNAVTRLAKIMLSYKGIEFAIRIMLKCNSHLLLYSLSSIYKDMNPGID
jgi:hypothetical protein